MKVVLYGAGDHAREVAEILSDEGREVLGYLDDDPNNQGRELDGLPVLGGEAWLQKQSREEIEVLPATGNPRVLKLMMEKVRSSGFQLARAVHPSAHISKRAVLGPGVLVFPRVVINTGAYIGSCVCLNIGVSVSHDCRIGDCCNINPGVRLAGRVTVGDQCYLGMGSQCIQGLRIGSGVTLGAGAVVIEDIPAGVLAVGVPAKVVKKL
jgi:sugar O-acyltransferase (sialic acid O-acetyltransferase NeuD family)